ncbi:MAG: peptidase P60 [Pseudomonadota bacterium]
MTELELRHAIVASAVTWLGTPYRHQASLKGVGCDCLGLVRGVWRDVCGPEPEAVPPYAPDMDEAHDAGVLQGVAKRHFHACEAMNIGSLLLLRWHPSMPAKHLGIVETPDEDGACPVFIHAHSSAGVCRARLEGRWVRRLAGTFDFPKPVTNPEGR